MKEVAENSSVEEPPFSLDPPLLYGKEHLLLVQSSLMCCD